MTVVMDLDALGQDKVAGEADFGHAHFVPVLVIGDEPVSVSDVLRAFRDLDDEDQRYILRLARELNGAKSAVSI